MAKSKEKEAKRNNKIIGTNNAEFEKYVFKILIIFIGVLLFLTAFYFITVGIVSGDKQEENAETAIQYEQILAGSSFGMRDQEYLVAYYDFSDEDLAELSSVIYNYSYMGIFKLYSVDMSEGFNKKYVSENSNISPENASELAIDGPTLIKIVDGSCVDYIEGTDAIIDYLN